MYLYLADIMVNHFEDYWWWLYNSFKNWRLEYWNIFIAGVVTQPNVTSRIGKLLRIRIHPQFQFLAWKFSLILNEVLTNILQYKKLEIKPCGLGSRIRDLEAYFIYWWTFLTSMEVVRGQTPYNDCTFWHFNSMFGPSHSAKKFGRCMVFGL